MVGHGNMDILKDEKHTNRITAEYHLNWQWIQDGSGDCGSWRSCVYMKELHHQMAHLLSK